MNGPVDVSVRESYSSPMPRALEREFFIDNQLARIHFIIMMIRWSGIAPWEFEFPFLGSLTSTFLQQLQQSNSSTLPLTDSSKKSC